MKQLFFLFAIALSACGTVKHKSGITTITFGNGGGFTGEVNTYVLSETGKLSKDGNELKTLSSEALLAIFTEAGNIDAAAVSDPGNMYFFLHITKEGTEIRYVWNNKTNIDPKVKALHSRLSALLTDN